MAHRREPAALLRCNIAYMQCITNDVKGIMLHRTKVPGVQEFPL
jgi:hypothetical protein